jgi:iron complex transport system ATP-binding protein
MSALVASEVVVRRGGHVALDGVSLRVDAGELVALVGPNGSGKTTLLTALLGTTPIAAGAITLDGAPLASIAPRARARALTMVAWTAPPDFALRARDLVALGRIPYTGAFGAHTREDEDAVSEAMELASCAAFADRTIDTLSAGEHARVQLARALAQRAKVMLLDEPTANLDLRHQLETMRVLRDFCARGGAVVAAMHDLTLAARACDRVLVLDGGRVRAEGAPHTAFDEAILARVFGVRPRIARDDAGRIESILALDERDRLSGETS